MDIRKILAFVLIAFGITSCASRSKVNELEKRISILESRDTKQRQVLKRIIKTVRKSQGTGNPYFDR
jgi:hypothetical protein